MWWRCKYRKLARFLVTQQLADEQPAGSTPSSEVVVREETEEQELGKFPSVNVDEVWTDQDIQNLTNRIMAASGARKMEPERRPSLRRPAVAAAAAALVLVAVGLVLKPWQSDGPIRGSGEPPAGQAVTVALGAFDVNGVPQALGEQLQQELAAGLVAASSYEPVPIRTPETAALYRQLARSMKLTEGAASKLRSATKADLLLAGKIGARDGKLVADVRVWRIADEPPRELLSRTYEQDQNEELRKIADQIVDDLIARE